MKRPAWMTPARGFAAAVILLVALGGYVAFAALRFNENLGWVAHSYRVLEQTERLDALEHQTVTAQRTYLLTGNRLYADAFWSSGAEAKLAATNLKALTADNPKQTARVSHAMGLMEKRFAVLSQALSTIEWSGRNRAVAAQQVA